MSLRLIGMGTAVPEHSIDQTQAAEIATSFATRDAQRARMLAALYRRSGVRKRYSVLLRGNGRGSAQDFYPQADGPDDLGPPTEIRMRRYEAEAPALAAEAARRALDDSGLDGSDVTHVVTVSCTGFFAPGLDITLIDRLALPPSVERIHVGFMGCHGALNALRVASSFAQADRAARVLVTSVELCSLHFAYGWDPELLVANALFADGAAAVVGVPDDAPSPGPTAEAPADDDWRVLATGAFLVPDSAGAMSWRIGDHGFRMTLSSTVPDLIRSHLGGWLEGWLGRHGLGPTDVASWAVHPGGPRILSAAGEAIGLANGALDVSRDVLAEYGNMSSATILFILDRLRRTRAPRPCVALAFGPGLVVEATLLG